jgi:Fic family protein
MRGRYEHRVWQWNPSTYAPSKYRRGCEYEAFVPERIAGLEPDLPGAVAGVVSDAETAIAELNRGARLELQPLARLLLRTESIASSKVEGMQVETRTLARAEAKQEVGRSIGADAAEILANIDAMQLAIERAVAAHAIAQDDLLDIHSRLLARAPNATAMAGKFRQVQNWIGGNDYNPCAADFVPPPPEEIPSLLEDLCRFANDAGLPPLVQAAIAHAQFETIHPFEDGNGRTGRALVQVILRRRGLAPTFVPPISVALARNKGTYIRGLTDFREGLLSHWIEVFAAATAQAATLATRYVASVERLQETWREQVRSRSNPRSDAAVWNLIKVLPAHPIITVAIGVAATRRTKPAVSNGISELQNAAVLTPLTTSPRNRAWEAPGLLDLIEELESADWPASMADAGEPHPSEDGLRALDTTWRRFSKTGEWPTIREIDNDIHAELRRDGEAILKALPPGLVSPETSGQSFLREDYQLRLTLRGLEFVSGAQDLLRLYVEVVAEIARRADDFRPADATEYLKVTSFEMARVLGLDPSDTRVSALFSLLRDGLPGFWRGMGGGPDGWEVTVNEPSARRYRDVGSIDELIARVEEYHR